MTDISDDGYLCLMSDNGDLREDLKIPEGEIGTQLKNEYDNGKELLVSYRYVYHQLYNNYFVLLLIIDYYVILNNDTIIIFINGIIY